MPAAGVDQQKSWGSCYIWAVAIFLFLSVTTGGIFLALYMIEPQPTPGSSTDNIGWYPYAGVALVALPWFFWILTLLYRVISRAFGFRIVCWNTPSLSEPAPAAAPAPASTANGGIEAVASMEEGTRTVVSTPTGGGGGGNGVRRVQFGGAVVFGEENDQKNETSSPLSVRSNDSQDSEAPLRYAMASS